MVLFIISFLMIFISSYFLASILSNKNSVLGLIYLSILSFAQIVLTFEVLSLFNLINQNCVLILNLIFLLGSTYFWFKKNKPILLLDISNLKKRIANSMKLDKSLIWLFVGFCVFIMSTIFLCFIMPVNNADALGYHIARCVYWIQQGNLNHFIVSDVRNLCLPINSEILYTWVILFVKTDVFIGFFAFTGYLLSIISIYKILGYCGFCTRKRLWTVFIMSSLPSVLVQSSSTQTDIIIAGLIASSIFLFWHALKNNEKIPIYMASIAYALAIGTKTPAIIMIPGIGILFFALCLHYKNFRPLLEFIILGFINFIIFSSYNYILNFISYGNFMGAPSYITVNKNYFGIKGAIANFIKHLFMFIDFSGFTFSLYLDPIIQNIRLYALNFLGLGHIPDSLYTNYSPLINIGLFEETVKLGFLGFLVYLPCIILSQIKVIFKPKSVKTKLITLFGLLFLTNMIVMSYLINYSSFNTRYIVAFVIISAPVLIYSYSRKTNIYKIIIILASLYSLTIISTHLWSRPLFKVLGVLKKSSSVAEFRKIYSCKNFKENPEYSDPICNLSDNIEATYSPQNRILAFINTSGSIYFLKLLYFKGYKIDLYLMENAPDIDFSKYNIVITESNKQRTTSFNEELKLKNKDIYCNDLFDKNPKKYSEIVPFSRECELSNSFLTNRKFELLKTIEYISPTLNTNKAYFYNNKLLPVHLKKRNSL